MMKNFRLLFCVFAVAMTALTSCSKSDDGMTPPDGNTGGNAITYVVTFNANGGEVSPATATTDDTGKVATYPVPTYDGYTFKGWFTAASDGTEVTTSTVFKAATTIYAQWEVSTYTITLDANGGEVSPTSLGADAEGKITTFPEPTREGYTFLGWFDVASGGTQITAETVFTSDKTIYAQWQEDTFTITLNANEGISPSTTIGVDADGKLITTLPEPTRDGYKFKGWFTLAIGGEEITAETIFTEASTIYAQWLDEDITTLAGTTWSSTDVSLLPNGYSKMEVVFEETTCDVNVYDMSEAIAQTLNMTYTYNSPVISFSLERTPGNIETMNAEIFGNNTFVFEGTPLINEASTLPPHIFPVKGVEIVNSSTPLDFEYEVEVTPKQLEYRLVPAYATNKKVVWSSEDDKIASVDPVTGMVTPESLGKTKIFATSDDGGLVAERAVNVYVAYEVGDVYPYGATGSEILGVVFEVDRFGRSGKIVSATQAANPLKWAVDEVMLNYSLHSNDNGRANMGEFMKAITDGNLNLENYQALAYVHKMNTDAEIDTDNYSSNVEGVWYLPSRDELYDIYNNKTDLNATLENDIISFTYWSSTPVGNRLTQLSMSHGTSSSASDITAGYYVRAVMAF